MTELAQVGKRPKTGARNRAAFKALAEQPALLVDILPTLKCGDSSRETAMSCRENVLSRIDISIM